MDLALSGPKSNRSHHTSNKQRRLRADKRENYPNGYLESWSEPLRRHSSVKSETPVNSPEPSVDQPIVPSRESGFNLVSIILSTQDNMLLNKQNNYEMRFSTGVLEGNGITINETGSRITFEDEGSYRFEICGEATLFSDVNVLLVYDSDKFSSEIAPFSTTKVPKAETTLQLRGIPTILPIQKNQTVVARLVPNPDESIMLIAGARLLIHRVA